jgi:hypothetical protein
MFQSLVSAMLSVMIGNDGSCINAASAHGNARTDDAWAK